MYFTVYESEESTRLKHYVIEGVLIGFSHTQIDTVEFSLLSGVKKITNWEVHGDSSLYRMNQKIKVTYVKRKKICYPVKIEIAE